MLLPKSARESLENLCDVRDQSWTGDIEDLRAFRVGDWLGSEVKDGLLPGKLLTIRSDAAAKVDPSSASMNISGSATGYSSSGSGGGNKRRIPLYECVLGAEQAIPADWPASLYMPWEETLQFYDPGEQVMLLASVFPQDMVRYAFEGMPYAPDSIMRGRVISTPRAEESLSAPSVPTAVAPTAPPDTSSAPWNSGAGQPPPSGKEGAAGFAFGTPPGPLPVGDATAVVRPEAPLVSQPVGDPTEADKLRAAQLEKLREAREAIK